MIKPLALLILNSILLATLNLNVSENPTDYAVSAMESEPTPEESYTPTGEWCSSVVDKTLAALPEAHTEELDQLELIFETNAKRGQAGGHIIKLRCVDVSEQELTAVLVHEMGHVVDLGMLEGSSWAGNSKFVDGSKPVKNDDPSIDFYELSWNDDESDAFYNFVSGYASTDPFEDFAESYVYYVLHGESFRELADVNDILDAKYAFLRDEVFEGVEYYENDLEEPSLYKRPYDITLLDFDLNNFQI